MVIYDIDKPVKDSGCESLAFRLFGLPDNSVSGQNKKERALET